MNAREFLFLPSGLISLEKLIRLTSRMILLPYYHVVSDRMLPHVNKLYSIRNIKQFTEDIDFYCAHFNPVTISELSEITNPGKSSQKPVFHLTFDDGLREIFDLVAPVLERKGIPATFFLNTQFIDNKELFYRYKVSLILNCIDKKPIDQFKWLPELLECVSSKKSVQRALLGLKYQDTWKIDLLAKNMGFDFNEYLEKEKPYLKSEEVEDLIRRGFTIGSHSIDHPHLMEISPSEQKKQVTDSFSFLKVKFSIDKKYFSFPFDDVGVPAEFFNWLYEQEKCLLSFGSSGLKEDFCTRHLHRIFIERYPWSARQILKTEYMFFYLKSFINRNKIERK